MRPRRSYLLAAAALLAAEVAIALGLIPGAVVRNSVGDALATALLFLLLRAARLGLRPALAASLAVSFAVEGLQLLGLPAALGLRPGSLPAIILGSTFSPDDLLAYAAGGAAAALLDARTAADPRRGVGDRET